MSVDPRQVVIVGQPQPFKNPTQPPMPPGPQPPPQPVQSEWMPMLPVVEPNCPPGLEYLTQIDQILVHQQLDLLEIITGFEMENKYIVKNSLGQKMFDAVEKSTSCQRACCKNIREFYMAISDNFGNEVMRLHRPLACQGLLCPCCLQKMEITSPPGNVIGSIDQQWSIYPNFTIKDALENPVLKIRGPFCTSGCCSDVKFNVFTKDGGTKIGRLTKQWSGYVREAYTDADNFGIYFPMDLDVKMKALLLGACFLIDFMYFEDPPTRRRR